MKQMPSLVVPPYHVQLTAKELRSEFPYFPYHEKVSTLWSDKWRPPCAKGIYPFTDAQVEDFDPIFAELVTISGDDPAILYRPDDYARPFLPVAQDLLDRATAAESKGNKAGASELYLRSAAVFRISRFPINRSPVGESAWQRGKAAYVKGGRLLDPPIVPVDIPFTHADIAAGDAAKPIEAYLRMPKGDKPQNGWPIVLFICGLDAYKTDNTPRTDVIAAHGIASLMFEIPGTGDCPAAPNDPNSPDRLMSSLLDWVDEHAAEYGFDTQRKLARGISTGGYYAIRVAHTHADRLFAVVSEGGSCHHMFDAAWIGAQNQMDYPFALADALAYKFGYRGDSPVERYTAEAHKFSQLDAGIIDRPSTRLLLLDGLEDSIFPIEDNLLVALRGRNRELLSRANVGHMGNPGGEELLTAWFDNVLAGKPAGIGLP